MIGAHWETDAATGWMHRSDEDITEHTLTSVLRVLSPFAAYSSDVELIIMSIVPPGFAVLPSRPPLGTPVVRPLCGYRAQASRGAVDGPTQSQRIARAG